MKESLLLVAASTLTGWVVLFPVRRRLGGALWALLGLPIGALAWQVAAVITSFGGWPLSYAAIAVGLVLFGVVVFAAFATVARSESSHDADRRSVLPAFAALAVLGSAAVIVLGRGGFTRASFDSYNFYVPYGIWLARTGKLTSDLVAERMTLLPAMHAAADLFGTAWLYLLYPAFALVAVGLTAWLPLRLIRAERDPFALGVAVIAAGVMAQSPPFLVHATLVHSHMVSAVYLLIAVFGVLLAARSSDEPGQSVWALVAGLAAAGLAAARPDGLAYVFVPVGVALAFSLTGALSRASVVRLFAPPVALSLLVISPVLATEGLWSAPKKLGGAMALAMIAALVLAGIVAFLLAGRARRRPISESLAMTLVLAGGAIALGAVFALRSAGSLKAVSMMVQNMAVYGMWGPLWLYLAAAATVVAVAVPSREPQARRVLVGVGLFFVIALAVHGATHPGRIGWGDSMNRVLMHVVPLLFAAVATGAVTLVRSSRALDGVRRGREAVGEDGHARAANGDEGPDNRLG